MKGLVRYQSGASTPTTTGVTFQKTRVSSDLILTDLDAINQNDYIYCNEPTLLESTSSISVNRSATPTTVVASAYSTEGNGGRKLVRLSNGWVVASAKNASNAIIYFVSKDNGSTWAQLCYSGNNVTWYAITSVGTTIHVVENFSTDNSANYRCKFDATTISNINLDTISGVLDTGGQTSFGNGVSIEADKNGAVHAAWCSKNATYANSFNIRYSKSVDGGLTWATPTQITTLNAANITGRTVPCIVVGSNNGLYIFNRYQDVTYSSISVHIFNGVVWSSSISVYDSSATYPQNTPCSVIDSLGVIHTTWVGTVSGDGVNKVMYSRSVDGGFTWSTAYRFTDTYSHDQPVITCDSSNNVYLIWYAATSGANQIKMAVCTGGVWGSVVALTSGTSNQNWPQVCANYTNFTSPLIMWQDLQTSSIKFRGTWTDYSIQLIPSIEQTYSSDQIKASFDGTLKTYLQTDVKKYEGFASPTKVGTVVDSYTKLLLHMDGVNGSTVFTDSSAKPKSVAVLGNTQISTAQSKFGGASGYFDGTGDYLEVIDNDDLSVGSGDFTVDCWIRRGAIGTTQHICGQSDSSGTTNTMSFALLFGSANVVYGQIISGSTAYNAVSTGTIVSTSAWYHIALVRNGNNLNLYINGTQDGAVSVTGISANNSAYKFAIGRNGEYAANYFNGYIDELRISKGIARWTSNFTPPTSAYTITS